MLRVETSVCRERRYLKKVWNDHDYSAACKEDTAAGAGTNCCEGTPLESDTLFSAWYCAAPGRWLDGLVALGSLPDTYYKQAEKQL